MLQPFEPSNPKATKLVFFLAPLQEGRFPLKKGTLGEGMPPKSNSEWKAWRIQLASSNRA